MRRLPLGRGRCSVIAVLLALSIGFAQTTPQTILRSTAQEVLLDFVARDKHQNLVTDLRAEDIEVLDDGVPQTLRSFQYRHGRQETAPPAGSAPAEASARAMAAPVREINLVSLVFEALGAENRREAAQAAKDFLANQLDSDTYVGVFTLNHRLALLQQYTNDADLLNKAVDRALAGAYQEYAKDTDKQVARLNSLAANQTQFQSLQPGSAEERGPADISGGHGAFAAVERRMAAVSTAILMEQVGNLSIDALQRLIEAQAQLPGRKTIVYFSPGLILPPEQPDRFRAVISAANRANIAFYTVDPSGLETASNVKLAQIRGRAVRIVEQDPGPKETNFKENLRSLAESTGGFAIGDTNDARVSLRRVMEEVRAHYEASYAPASANYDGQFRTIEIRTRRPGVHIQGRNGYFALPTIAGISLAPFEFDALRALEGQPEPHAFDFHAGVLMFRAGAEQTECRAVFSVPSEALHFTEDRENKRFHIHVEFLALVKDAQDQVVRKISRDLVFQAPEDKRAEFERGEVTVTLPLSLPPGRYHLEAVANDTDGRAASTRKIAIVVPSAGRLSDLVLVRSLQPAGEGRDIADPLDLPAGKITPEMKATILKANGGAEGIYFVLYPGPNANPDVRIAVTHNGNLVTSARANLPPPEADGSLRVLTGIPFGGFDPGVYEVTVSATLGGSTSRRTAIVEVQ